TGVQTCALPISRNSLFLLDGPGVFRRTAHHRYTLEQTSWLLRVGNQHVLGLLIVRHHHQVVLTTQTGLLVAAESGVSWVDVVVVHPHASSLDVAARPIRGVLAASPQTAAKTEVGVISNLDGFVIVLEGCYR